MVKRKESCDTLVQEQYKRQRVSPLYRTQATQTFEVYKSREEDRILEWAESLPELEMSDKSLTRSWSERTGDSRSSAIEMTQYGIVLHELKPLNQTCPYLEGELEPGQCLVYPKENLDRIIYNAGAKNEAFVQRDILPWTVPSIFNLCMTGEWSTDIAYEEQIHKDWKCETMGSSRPRPDYVVGLSEAALSVEAREVYRTKRSIAFNEEILMPFLVCEAKSGTSGMKRAEKQNIHAGSILVRAMFNLYKEAGETIYEEVLAWTIDLNHETVRIYGHYGKLDNGEVRYYRHKFKDVRLDMPAERFIPYNFVRNLYQDFMPKHLERIEKALLKIRPAPGNPKLVALQKDYDELKRDHEQQRKRVNRMESLLKDLADKS